MLRISAVFNKPGPEFRFVLKRIFSDTAIGIVDFAYIKQISGDLNKALIDVRGRDETRQSGGIPGSINIPQDYVAISLGPKTNNTQFYEQFGREKPTANSQLVFYCRSGKRARESAQQAIAMGYRHVKIYEGSWNDWEEHEYNHKA